MELATLVTGVTYRYPGLLAKTVSTLDVLSQGRAQLGIGTAWYEREHLGLGVPYPPTTERFERLEETLQIVLQMWSDNDGPYNGRDYQLAETLCRPRPVSAPRPRIMIGGNGENKTLRLVAQYADVTNIIPGSVAEAVQISTAIRERSSGPCSEASSTRTTRTLSSRPAKNSRRSMWNSSKSCPTARRRLSSSRSSRVTSCRV